MTRQNRSIAIAMRKDFMVFLKWSSSFYKKLRLPPDIINDVVTTPPITWELGHDAAGGKLRQTQHTISHPQTTLQARARLPAMGEYTISWTLSHKHTGKRSESINWCTIADKPGRRAAGSVGGTQKMTSLSDGSPMLITMSYIGLHTCRSPCTSKAIRLQTASV